MFVRFITLPEPAWFPFFVIVLVLVVRYTMVPGSVYVCTHYKYYQIMSVLPYHLVLYAENIMPPFWGVFFVCHFFMFAVLPIVNPSLHAVLCDTVLPMVLTYYCRMCGQHLTFSSSQGSSTNGCFLFRYHHGPLFVHLPLFHNNLHLYRGHFVLISHIQRIGCPSARTTLHDGQPALVVC